MFATLLMEQQQQSTQQSEAPPDTKEILRKLQDTTGIANGILEDLHVQGGMLNNTYT